MSKGAVVTGGGSGIGRALAVELAKRGYEILIGDISVEDSLATKSLVEEVGGRAVVLQCDVAEPASVGTLVEAAGSKYPWPDLVFSNAGVALAKPAIEYTQADLQWIFSVNVFGMWEVAAAYGRSSIASGRPVRIVVTGSEHSLGLPHDGMAAYTAAKHATLGFAEVMRSEWKDRPPSISILCPGLSQSRLWDGERHRGNTASDTNPFAETLMNAGMPAETVARIAVDGAERGDFYILSHAHVGTYADVRHNEIDEALKHLSQDDSRERSYEVRAVAAQLAAKGS